MFKRILFISTHLLMIGFSSLSKAQDLENDFLPEYLGFSNQLEYSNDISRKLEIFEDWLNVDYHKGIFGAGIRFETFQPNDPNPSISRGKNRYADIAYKYIKASIGDAEKGGEITVGNFYTLFGRGLVLKSYEERNIRVDNNLLGVKLAAKYAGFNLIALTGAAANADNERKDILHAVDLEYRIIKGLNLGGSFVSDLPGDGSAPPTMLSSIRMIPSIWNFGLYVEYGVKMNEDVKKSSFNNNVWKVGEAYYGSLNFCYNALALTGEYKYYDNFAFTSQDGTIIYNTPPSVRKDYTYSLLNRHPSVLNQSDEQGFQVDVNYNPSDETYFSGNYGETRTLSSGSYYKRILDDGSASRIQSREIYAQVYRDWSNNWTTIAAFGYNEERDTDTKNLTPILENKFYFDDINTIMFTIEHQQTEVNTTAEQYYDDALTVEYLRSPNFSVSLVSEMQTREPEAGRKIRRFWNFIQFGYNIGNHTNVSLLFGTRQAGNICVGGVCRYEPEFRGIELRMFTRF
jgi:hypothetical protein